MQKEVKRPKRPKAPKQENALVGSVSAFFLTLPPDTLCILCPPGARTDVDALRRALADSAPKRWVVYEPMVLLPSGSFKSGPWEIVLRRLTGAQRNALWSGILGAISKTLGKPLTHLAVNDGIPLHVDSDAVDLGALQENLLRSPSGLKMVSGDFGGEEAVSCEEDEASKDRKFRGAFWVSTKQNGIQQVWAPRWTMFSRGNIKEKARLLAFHDRQAPESRSSADPSEEDGLLPHKVRSKADLQRSWAVDLYAGIGYFVFSYAKLGLRVLCWEINPWSVEGLKRGAEANRWSVRVVSGLELERPMTELVAGGEQIIVFLDDNANAQKRIDELRRSDPKPGPEVLHVNCGFLPSSIETWRPAWSIQGPGGDGWLHLHENVGVNDIQTRRSEVQQMFDAWQDKAVQDRTAHVEHVELVKTFAPDVWHCVFDVYVTNSNDNRVNT